MSSPSSPNPHAASPAEWFARDTREGRNGSAAGGLRFQCTMCGNCCSGPPGYVLVTPEESARLAARLGLSIARFERAYTSLTREGRSLVEKKSPHGLDCVFLDREKIPGRAVCGVYEDRPAQCRTWPYWPSLLRSERAWVAAKKTCPGIDHGPLIPPERIRILRDTIDI
ncbi:MAG: YkgJ family cysteine cluster protein [Phycisphaerae bacterium]|nr:YkgJ family cysteine cluster protein [Phycisphaerae bacterium]